MMEVLFGFGVFVLVIVALILPFVHVGKLRRLADEVARLKLRLDLLESAGRPAAKTVAPQPAPAAAPAAEPAPERPPHPSIPEPAILRRPAAVPPPLPTATAASAAAPSSLPVTVPAPRQAPVASKSFDWEAFMGVKLFAWLGGFILFLGVVFLVKYSFENNLISPPTRVLFGALIGLGLVAAGWRTSGKFRVPGQSLCATGILVLYAAIFAAHSFYQLIPLVIAFVLMSCVTIGAFLLAIRLNAQVIVVLGLLGGFVTPVLLSTNQDNPGALFAYIALLNAGVAAIAIRKGWSYLVPLAALSTIAMEYGWASRFFEWWKVPVAFAIFIGFQLQFLAVSFVRRHVGRSGKWTIPAGVMTGFSALFFGTILLAQRELGYNPAWLFAFIFAADAGLLVLAFSGGQFGVRRSIIGTCAGIGTFLLLAGWTAVYLNQPLLWWALGAYILFAALHGSVALWPRPPEKKFAALSLWYVPLLALGLVVVALFKENATPALWAAVLLIDVMAIGIALASRSIGAIIAALVCTLFAAGVWVFSAPSDPGDLFGFLLVSGGFGVFFFAASLFFSRRLRDTTTLARQAAPAMAAALPFLLLQMLVVRLELANPTPVFAVAFLLAALLLGLSVWTRTHMIAWVALAFSCVLLFQWQEIRYTPELAVLPLTWYVAFLLLFAGYPYFVAEKRATAPWAISAVAGALLFYLVYDAMEAFPGLRNGLLPAIFIVPYAVGLWFLIKRLGIAASSGSGALAWQGGAALFFVSLIFPIQFEREWITIGWAVEGLALIWLFRHVPHRGLPLVATILLSIAFVRLALNPAVLEYHPRAATRLWNWYLYAYGITTLCLLAGGALLRRDHPAPPVRVARPLLFTLGTVLAFLLLNIEIADYFSIGPTLTFSFSGDFARDMTYSIGWAVFAFVLLLVGIWRHARAPRYGALALLALTLMKLFLHDLANLGPLYRIGAFIGVAVILIVASFIYQRFLSRTKTTA